MEGREAPQPWVRWTLTMAAVVFASNAAFWGFVGLDDQGWLRPVLAIAFAVLACSFGFVAVRLRA